jgi:hypothetical protein
MRRRGVLGALALVVATNLVVLAGVAWNRRGAPEAALDLTEREAPLGFIEKEDSGLAFRLDWRMELPGAEHDELDRDRLEALGFDCHVPPDDPSAELFYSKALPLQRFAVLENEGDAWARHLARQEREVEATRLKVEQRLEGEPALKNAREALDRERRLGSRLFVVDAGTDAAALRRLYPDRARDAVVPALVRLWLNTPWDEKANKPGKPILKGSVSQILVDGIHVARRFRPGLAAALRAPSEPEYPDANVRDRPPRYRATVKFGRRLEPWVATVLRLEERPAAP